MLQHPRELDHALELDLALALLHHPRELDHALELALALALALALDDSLELELELYHARPSEMHHAMHPTLAAGAADPRGTLEWLVMVPMVLRGEVSGGEEFAIGTASTIAWETA